MVLAAAPHRGRAGVTPGAVSPAATRTAVPPGLSPTFAALSDPTRLAVVALLRHQPRRAGEIASTFGMSPPAMSRHLRVLRRAGLVEEAGSPDDARVRMYRLRRERFAELEAWLAEIAAFWGDQPAAFAPHVEASRG